MRPVLRSGLVLGLLLYSVSSARAYTEPRTYVAPASEGGGGGRFFTGSPAEGYRCSVCHESREREQVELSGLPQHGYVPGQTYELLLAWPELARRHTRLRERGDGPPSMSVVAELVAESGRGAGTIELIRGSEVSERDLCVVPEGQQGAVLFALRPGEPAHEAGTHCDSNRLGQRCVVAVLSCGVERLRVRWTAPTTWQGAIWLSAGLVATDRVSVGPEDDSVTEFSEVILPAASSAERHRSTLRSGCTVGPAPQRTPAALLLCTLAALALLARRSRSRAFFTPALALALSSCADFDDRDPLYLPPDPAAHPLAGLYTPGSTLGYEPLATAADAGSGLSAEEQRALDNAIAEAQAEDRCAPLAAEPGTPGMLTIAFESTSYGGFYEPTNCGAVWIEDAEGHYVATPVVWAALRLRNLFVWNARRCDDDAPDAVSSATLETHAKHSVVWDGTDLTGAVAPDGRYVLNLEITEDELAYGRHAEHAFDKGAEAWSLALPDSVSIQDLTLEYTPAAEAAP